MRTGLLACALALCWAACAARREPAAEPAQPSMRHAAIAAVPSAGSEPPRGGPPSASADADAGADAGIDAGAQADAGAGADAGAEPDARAAEAVEPAASAAPTTGSVVVELVGVRSARGNLLVALFRSAKGFPEEGRRASAKLREPARAGTVSMRFESIPPGAFAISAHHDEDGDLEMDTGLFGIPQEGYGFSRNASAPFGPPDFAAARLRLAAGETKTVRIRLRY